MLELTNQEHLCPSCQDTVYPGHKAVQKILCGDEHLICYPPGKKYQAPDCQVYYFCSNDCVKAMESKISTCRPVPRWKRLMARISKVSIEKGIAGARAHQLRNS